MIWTISYTGSKRICSSQSIWKKMFDTNEAWKVNLLLLIKIEDIELLGGKTIDKDLRLRKHINNPYSIANDKVSCFSNW